MFSKNIDRRTAGLGILGLLVGCGGGGGSTEEITTPENPVPVEPVEIFKIPRVARYTEVEMQTELTGTSYLGNSYINFNEFFEILKEKGHRGFEFLRMLDGYSSYYYAEEMAIFFRNEKFPNNKYDYVRSPANNSKEDKIYQLNEYGASGYRSIGSFVTYFTSTESGRDHEEEMFFVKDVLYPEIYDYQYRVIGDNSPAMVAKDIVSYLGQMGADGYRLVSGENLELCCLKDGSSAKYSYVAIPRYRNGIDNMENIVREMARENYQYEFKIDVGFGKFYNPQDSVIFFSKTSLQEDALEVDFFQILKMREMEDSNPSLVEDLTYKLNSMLDKMRSLVDNGYIPHTRFLYRNPGFYLNQENCIAYKNSKNISLDQDPFSTRRLLTRKNR